MDEKKRHVLDEKSASIYNPSGISLKHDLQNENKVIGNDGEISPVNTLEPVPLGTLISSTSFRKLNEEIREGLGNTHNFHTCYGFRVLVWSRNNDRFQRAKQFLESEKLTVYRAESMVGFHYLIENKRINIVLIDLENFSDQVKDLLTNIGEKNIFIIGIVPESNKSLRWTGNLDVFNALISPTLNKEELQKVLINISNENVEI
ncbi:hypothetical protein GCM10028791_43530 [Echinicola sediminis]